MRKAAVAGQFYDADASRLKENLKELLSQPKKSDFEADMTGMVVPHAGYVYSGKAAASAYNLIRDQKIDTFVIIGPNHSGLENAISFENFETSLGIAENDNEFGKELMKNSDLIKKDENAHKYEHCIEVQLPFLQFLFKKIKIVPVLVGSLNYEGCKKIAEAIEKTARKLKRKICVIASSDFTHYGKGYNFIPFSGTNEEIKKKLYDLDKKAISFIEKLHGKEFLDYSEKTTICGRFAITIAVEFAKLQKSKVKLIDYYTSGDVASDYRNAVGYASIVFYR